MIERSSSLNIEFGAVSSATRSNPNNRSGQNFGQIRRIIDDPYSYTRIGRNAGFGIHWIQSGTKQEKFLYWRAENYGNAFR